MPWRHCCFRIERLLQVSAALTIVALVGCSGGENEARLDDQPAPPSASDTDEGTVTQSPAPVEDEFTAHAPALAAEFAAPPTVEPAASPAEPAEVVEADAEDPAEQPSLDELLAELEIPPPWLAQVQTQYDTSKPWKEARLEIRRLLGFGKPETHREAIKVMWIYLQKDDIGDGHEYPMYTFMGGEPVWSIRAHEEYIAKPHEHSPIHAYIPLASLYAQYGEFEKAKASLDAAMGNLPEPPWRIMRRADVLHAFGDLYAAWGKPDEAKRYYADAVALYPTAKPPYGGHLLPRRAAKVKSKLDLLTFRSLETATLRDGRYQDKALGYVGDIRVTLVVDKGRIADIQLKHEEKIDQNACVLIPQRIIESQSLQVDGVSGATVTKDAIVNGVYRCLKQAGLR